MSEEETTLENLGVISEQEWELPTDAWNQEFGPDPSKWPLPPGQSLTWREWARALSAEAVARKWDSNLWPWPEDEMDDITCWTDDWLAGKTPKHTADEKQPYFDNATKAAE